MAQIQKIQDTLDGNYWQTQGGRERSKQPSFYSPRRERGQRQRMTWQEALFRPPEYQQGSPWNRQQQQEKQEPQEKQRQQQQHPQQQSPEKDTGEFRLAHLRRQHRDASPFSAPSIMLRHQPYQQTYRPPPQQQPPPPQQQQPQQQQQQPQQPPQHRHQQYKQHEQQYKQHEEQYQQHDQQYKEHRQEQDRQSPRQPVNYGSALLERIAHQQEQISHDIALLQDSAVQQKETLDAIFAQLQASSISAPQHDDSPSRPVTQTTFARFLMHFEENVAELRQSVDNLGAELRQSVDNLGAELRQSLESATQTDGSSEGEATLQAVVQETQEIREKQNCATQLLLLSELSPTMAQSLSKCEPPTNVWRWRAKSALKQDLILSDALSSAVEEAYKQYTTKGHIDRCLKTFEHETLYINFDSRQGTFERQPVMFERHLCKI